MKLLDAHEVADMLGVPVGWVREHTRAGNLPVVELGRYRRYDPADIEAWLEKVKAGEGPRFTKHRPAA